MAFDEPGIFELSWKNASSQKFPAVNQLNDYTIFWCENDKDRPYQCNVSKIVKKKKKTNDFGQNEKKV